MQIAQILSGYSLGEADMLRRAMGKKIKSEMDAQRDRFTSGAVKGGLTQKRATEIFDLLAKFADYGFNKSHAAAYALIAYQTAWFKANHPVEFLAASMTLDKPNTDKLSEFANEARRMGVSVEPPSVVSGGADFEVHPNDKGALCDPLRALGREGRRRRPGARPRRRARRPALQGSRGFRGTAQPARRQQARARKPDGGGRLRRSGERARQGLRRYRDAARRRQSPRAGARRRPERSLRHGDGGNAGVTQRAGLDIDGTAAARIQRGRVLPLRPSPRWLCQRPETPRHPALDGFRTIG